MLPCHLQCEQECFGFNKFKFLEAHPPQMVAPLSHIQLFQACCQAHLVKSNLENPNKGSFQTTGHSKLRVHILSWASWNSAKRLRVVLTNLAGLDFDLPKFQLFHPFQHAHAIATNFSNPIYHIVHLLYSHENHYDRAQIWVSKVPYEKRRLLQRLWCYTFI